MSGDNPSPRTTLRSRQTANFLAFVGALVSLALSAGSLPHPPLSRFTPPVSTQAEKSESAWARLEFLPSAAVSAHAVTLAELPDGRLASAWFTGSREGAADVRIVFSTRQAGRGIGSNQWSLPRPIANREQTVRDTHRSVRKLGNPVLFVDAGRLHLFYVSASLGGWAGSSINHRQSDDQGEHWQNAHKLITSPFLNVSTLVRTPPIKLADGSLGLPVYHELGYKYGEWLRLTPQGELMSKIRMPHPEPTLQPSLLIHDALRATALMRDAGRQGQIQTQSTQDGGKHWQPGAALPIANPDSSLVTLRLKDGRLLLAANPGSGREALDLWLSEDEGGHWRQVKQLQISSGERNKVTASAPAISVAPPACPSLDSPENCVALRELSYPALLQTRDGLIHLAYTWHRQKIQMLSFNTAWLDAGHPTGKTESQLIGGRQ